MGLGLGFGLSAIGSIAGGLIQASAAKKAARANERAQREAIAAQERARERVRNDSLAQIEIGQRAARTLAGTATEDGDAIGGAEGLGLDTTFQDERADFLQEEGQRAINRAAAARGQSFSGSALEAIGRNATDIRTASTQQKIDQLFALANLGTNAARGVGESDVNLTAQTSQSLSNIGLQNAASRLDRGAATAGIFTGIGGAGFATGVKSKGSGIDNLLGIG